MTKFWLKQFWTLSVNFPENCLHFVTQKSSKNWKMPFSNTHKTRFWAQDWLSFDLNSVKCFPSLSQKMVWTSLLKNLQKTKKCSFQMLRTFSFDVKVDLKPFSRKLLWPNFDLYCLERFPSFSQKNRFNFDTQKFAKNWKILFSNTHNTRFLAQRRFNTIF